MLDCCDYIAITNRLVNVILVPVYLWSFCRMCFADANFPRSPKFRGGSHQKLDAISLAFPEAMMRQRGTKVVLCRCPAHTGHTSRVRTCNTARKVLTASPEAHRPLHCLGR